MNIGFFDIPPGIERELLRLYELVHTNPEMIPWIEAKIDRIHDLFLTGQMFVPAEEADE